jgi:hypothetical protein
MDAARSQPRQRADHREDQQGNAEQGYRQLPEDRIDIVIEKSRADPPVPIGNRNHALQLGFQRGVRRTFDEHIHQCDMTACQALPVRLGIGQPGGCLVAAGPCADEFRVRVNQIDAVGGGDPVIAFRISVQLRQRALYRLLRLLARHAAGGFQVAVVRGLVFGLDQQIRDLIAAAFDHRRIQRIQAGQGHRHHAEQCGAHQDK